ncbi:Na+/H+ antiporter-like protein [Staphylococcus aureus]|nr:Na+/H+ antiporter-like protein [Staphylococcus aureus]
MEFLSLVIVVLAAFLTPIIVNRLNINFLPVVVAEILMGIVIGNFISKYSRKGFNSKYFINVRLYLFNVFKWFRN